jgi:hypothetical protein
LHLLVAAGADFECENEDGDRACAIAADNGVPPLSATKIDTARRRIAVERLDFVRNLALQVCVGLASLKLDALQMCEILQHACAKSNPSAR